MNKEKVVCPICKTSRDIVRKPSNEGKIFKCKNCNKKVMPLLIINLKMMKIGIIENFLIMVNMMELLSI